MTWFLSLCMTPLLLRLAGGPGVIRKISRPWSVLSQGNSKQNHSNFERHAGRGADVPARERRAGRGADVPKPGSPGADSLRSRVKHNGHVRRVPTPQWTQSKRLKARTSSIFSLRRRLRRGVKSFDALPNRRCHIARRRAFQSRDHRCE